MELCSLDEMITDDKSQIPEREDLKHNDIPSKEQTKEHKWRG